MSKISNQVFDDVGRGTAVCVRITQCVYNQILSQVDIKIMTQVDNQVWDQVVNQVRDQVGGLVCMLRFRSM